MQALQIAVALLMGAAVLVATFGGGGFLLVNQVPAVLEGWESRSWPSAPGVITRSEAVQKASPSGWSRGGTGTHVVIVRYEFGVQGRTYAGYRRSLDDEGKILSAENAQKAVDRLPVGLPVRAYHDPEDPTRSLLGTGVPVGGVLGCLFGVVLIATGITPFVLGQRIRAHRAKRRGARPA